MRFRHWLPASILALALLTPTRARAEKPSSPDATKTVGIGLAGTGVALVGAGAYFLYKGGADHDTTTTKLGVALFAGGAITTAAGLVIFLNGPEPEPKAPVLKHALLIGPTGASYVAAF
jgi:hypothetical protein